MCESASCESASCESASCESASCESASCESASCGGVVRKADCLRLSRGLLLLVGV